MKMKIMSLLLALVMMIGITACGKAEDTGKASSGKGEEAEATLTEAQMIGKELFADVEPLEETLTLSVGANNSAQAGFATALVEKLGGFDMVNLDIDLHIFDNGPVNVEAMVAGDTDVTAYGLGGMLAGTIGQDFVNIGGANYDYRSLMFFAPNDSEIVAAGAHNPDHPGLLGTPETWRGTEIFLPMGTNMHYVLYEGLKALGVSPDEIKMTHMNVPNVNTALRAGKAEVGGVWTNFSFGTLNEIATPVIKAGDFDIPMTVTIQAKKETLEDETKREAITKWLEVYFMAIEWVYASEENTELAVDWYVEFNKGNGVTSTTEEIMALVSSDVWLTLDDNLEMINNMSETGDYNIFVEAAADPLKFFVELGNYTQEDFDKFIKDEYYDFSIIKEIGERR